MRLAKISALLLLMTAVAAAQTPTAEQLQMFQELTPEQQQAVLKQIGGQSSDAGASAADGSSATRANAPRGRVGATATATTTATATATAEILGPDDLVIVELALPGTMRRDLASDEVNNVQRGAVVDSTPRRIRPDTALDDETRRRLTDIVEAVQARNPYRLDRSGQLILPGFPPILLGGLREQQAVQRLAVEPSLLQLDVSLQLLPVSKVGVLALKPFGYDMFDSQSAYFSSEARMPVPADYLIGPGDEFSVQLFGSQNRTHRLVVSGEGTVSFPELGPLRVGGLRFSEARSLIQSRVAQQMIGVQAGVSMSEMRSIDIFVLGEVRQPGSHTVSGLATITTALFVSGGISGIGSLRNIQLKRQGEVVRRLDLYDLLMEGNTADDAKLQAGDVVFVPPVGPTASIEGEVKRPAIYELRGEMSSAALLQMAGGLTTDADPSRSSLTRIDESFRRVVLDVNFRSDAAALALRNGDAVHVGRVRPQIDSGVILEGFVHRQGVMAWRQGMRLSDAIGSIEELKPNADARYVLIRRESGADRRIEALSADLVAALAERGGAADLVLQAKDRITVFDLGPGRERIIKPLLDELRLQAGLERPTALVRIAGQVKVPGEYPLEPGMTISDLIRAGGNLEVSAFGGKAELARYEIDPAGTRQTALIDVDIAAVLRGDPSADVVLRPFDYLLIKEIPDWTDLESVSLVGEFRFPGVYPIRRGESLYELIQRAGGLTPRAFPQGSAFTRAYLRDNEKQQKDLLVTRLKMDLAAVSLRAAASNQDGVSQSLAASQSYLEQLQNAVPVGRMVIDLPRLMEAGVGSSRDVSLRHGDVLVVPQASQEVTVIGEVQNSTSHRFDADMARDDYISLSGGTTLKADKRRIYVVRADGSVLASRGGLFRRGYDVAIKPGDTIVVPLDAERMPKLPLWQAVTQIIYNLAVSVAAINSF